MQLQTFFLQALDVPSLLLSATFMRDLEKEPKQKVSSLPPHFLCWSD
jgi:hypothetical protein